MSNKKNKILIFGGTSEGRRLCEELSLFKELDITVCVATDYGTEMLHEIENITVLEGRKDKNDILKLLEELSPAICVDATHPYAQIVSQNVKIACEVTGIEYLRLNRDGGSLNSLKSENENEMSHGVILFNSIDEVVRYLDGVDGNILITTGSKELHKYSKIENFDKKCYARVLPSVESIELCKKSGILSDHIIAMHGPYSVKLNEAIINQYDIKFMVTKASGGAGGYYEKVLAAQNTNVTLLVIRRPKETSDQHPEIMVSDSGMLRYDDEGACVDDDVAGYDTVRNSLIKRYCREFTPSIALVGVGPGNADMMTDAAIRTIGEAQVIIGSKRAIDTAKSCLRKHNAINLNKIKFIFSFLNDEIVAKIKAEKYVQKIVVLYSGSTAFSSGANELFRILNSSGFSTSIVNGVSSIQYLFEKCQISYDNCRLMTSHGRTVDLKDEIDAVFNKNMTLGLLPKDSVQLVDAFLYVKERYSDRLCYFNIVVGERLSYENESIMVYNVDSFLDAYADENFSVVRELDNLSAIIIYMRDYDENI